VRSFGNKKWYWQHRDEFVGKLKKGLIKPVLLIDEERVVGEFNSTLDGYDQMAQEERPHAYLIVIGDEDAPRRILLHEDTALLQADEVPKKLVHGRGSTPRTSTAGYLFGANDRPFFRLGVQTKYMKDFQYVDFLIDTGSPFSTLSIEASKSLKLNKAVCFVSILFMSVNLHLFYRMMLGFYLLVNFKK